MTTGHPSAEQHCTTFFCGQQNTWAPKISALLERQGCMGSSHPIYEAGGPAAVPNGVSLASPEASMQPGAEQH